MGTKRKHTLVSKEWGQEEWFENNELYCGKILTCRDRIWSSGGRYHYHIEKDETFYILEGRLRLEVEGDTMILGSGDSYRVLPGQKHRFRSEDGSCRFVEVATQHREEDSIRVPYKNSS